MGTNKRSFPFQGDTGVQISNSTKMKMIAPILLVGLAVMLLSVSGSILPQFPQEGSVWDSANQEFVPWWKDEKVLEKCKEDVRVECIVNTTRVGFATTGEECVGKEDGVQCGGPLEFLLPYFPDPNSWINQPVGACCGEVCTTRQCYMKLEPEFPEPFEPIREPEFAEPFEPIREPEPLPIIREPWFLEPFEPIREPELPEPFEPIREPEPLPIREPGFLEPFEPLPIREPEFLEPFEPIR